MSDVSSESCWIKRTSAQGEVMKDESSHLSPFVRVTYSIGLDGVKSIAYGQQMHPDRALPENGLYRYNYRSLDVAQSQVSGASRPCSFCV